MIFISKQCNQYKRYYNRSSFLVNISLQRLYPVYNTSSFLLGLGNYSALSFLSASLGVDSFFNKSFNFSILHARPFYFFFNKKLLNYSVKLSKILTFERRGFFSKIFTTKYSFCSKSFRTSFFKKKFSYLK